MLLNKSGVLLINLGTPDDPSVKSVKKYLKQFLSDPRVIDIPGILRWLLLRLVILPFRSPKSAEAYSAIWQDEGSPLLINSRKFAENLSGSQRVALGMRYGAPSIRHAIEELGDVDKITIVPMFPQYSSAATGSALQEAMQILQSKKNIPNIEIINSFHDNPGYIESVAKSIEPYLSDSDYLLMSYHGLPVRQAGNYREDCFATSQLIADRLSLSTDKYGVSFQSRLGRIPWIEPYTDKILPELYEKGVRRLVISSPSFVADCLESLEEIGLQARDQWLELGGESFTLVPCINEDATWLAQLLERN